MSDERTADGRYILVGGRRWRATDPTIPEDRRQELVDELMAARRAVAEAKRADDAGAERAARARVHAAKVALGERGPKWWERIEREVLEMVAARGPGRTICPSEVARSLSGDDEVRPLMPHVREAAAQLAERGEIAVTQKGERVDARSAKGPIRLGLINGGEASH
ncbi:MAG TPA: DUF3253 domain-containing protein [Thermoleophilaceae bacterium]